MKERSSEAKILAISGGGLFGSANVLDLARRLGADAVLAKPFRVDQVLEGARKLIEGDEVRDGRAGRRGQTVRT